MVTSAILIFALLALQAPGLLLASGCPASLTQTQNLQVVGDVCYQFVLDRRTHYLPAKTRCEALGGTLVMPKTKALNDWLLNMLTTNYHYSGRVWIGLQDIRQENMFKWEDGTLLTDTGFTNWDPTEGPASGPMHFREDCTALDVKDGLWHDHECIISFGSFGPFGEFDGFFGDPNNHNELAYVCQYGDAGPLITNAPTDTTTSAPTEASTSAPTEAPTSAPTEAPTSAPTEAPTSAPTEAPTGAPTEAPTSAPTDIPYNTPTVNPPTETSTASTQQTTVCPPFNCSLNCGLDGYETDSKGCSLCFCAGE